MASITTMLPDSCIVIRDGSRQEMLASELVPGDVVVLKAGNKLPADVRFMEVSSDSRFDRSILTGESVPLPGTVNHTDDNYLETKNIGMQGTHCISGSCLGIVIATADKTVFGRIAKLTNEPTTGLTPLEKEVLNFVMVIVSIMITMIVIVIIVWCVHIPFPSVFFILFAWFSLTHRYQGRVHPPEVSELDVCVHPDCQLRQCRHRVHSRGSANCCHRQSDHYRQHHAEESDLV
jgi:P-type E1-E2 ATPase